MQNVVQRHVSLRRKLLLIILIVRDAGLALGDASSSQSLQGQGEQLHAKFTQRRTVVLPGCAWTRASYAYV